MINRFNGPEDIPPNLTFAEIRNLSQTDIIQVMNYCLGILDGRYNCRIWDKEDPDCYVNAFGYDSEADELQVQIVDGWKYKEKMKEGNA